MTQEQTEQLELYRRLERLGGFMVADPDVRHDVVGDTFVKLWTRHGRYALTLPGLALRRDLVDQLRRVRLGALREALAEVVPEDVSGSEDEEERLAEQAEAREELNELVAQADLSDQESRVLWMVYYTAASVESITKTLRMTAREFKELRDQALAKVQWAADGEASEQEDDED